MSDIPPLNSFLKWKLGFQSPSLAYAAKPNSRSVILTVAIPYSLLKAWHGFFTELKKEVMIFNVQFTLIPLTVPISLLLI